MPARLTALLLATALCASAQSLVEGVVRDAADSSPVPGAHVFAVAGESRAVLAEASTDSQGRYRLEVAEPRFELTVEAIGYFVSRAGDLDADSIARTCPSGGVCAATDFLLEPATVLEGRLTDKYGKPVESIEIRLTPADEEPSPRRPPIPYYTKARNSAGMGVTDDRGYYRLWGVRPGSYRLATRRGGMRRHAGIPEPPTLERIIEIAVGEASVRVDLQFVDPPPIFTISGRIEGLASGDARWVTLESLDNGSREIVYVQDGKFSHPVPAGRYVARLEQVVNADPAEHQVDLLATLDVDRDLAELELQPKPPSGVRVHAEFVESPPTAFRLELRLLDRSAALPRAIQVGAGVAEVERHGFLPGDYAATVQAGDYYLVDEPRVTVAAGQIADVALRLSSQRATLRGRARFAAGESKPEAAHITVAVRGRETRSVQTDDSGVFFFEKLIPGDYEIAAWARPSVRAEREDAWREARDRVQRIAIEPGFEVEVDLTIAPWTIAP